MLNEARTVRALRKYGKIFRISLIERMTIPLV